MKTVAVYLTITLADLGGGFLGFHYLGFGVPALAGAAIGFAISTYATWK